MRSLTQRLMSWFAAISELKGVITSESASGNSKVVASQGKNRADDDGGFWTRAKLVGAATVGLATVAATVVGIAQWQQWSPF
jgi:hypothetical protein